MRTMTSRSAKAGALSIAAVGSVLALGAAPALAALDIYIPVGTPICPVPNAVVCLGEPNGFHAAAQCYGHYRILVHGPKETSDVWTRISGTNPVTRRSYTNWYVPKAHTGPRPGLPTC